MGNASSPSMQNQPMSASLQVSTGTSDVQSTLTKAVPKGPYLITDRVLGSGSTGKVLLALRRSDMTGVAVKIVTKSAKVKDEALREVQLLLQMKHKNIVKIWHLEEDDKYLYVFTEYLDRGDLWTYLQQHGTLSESDARVLFRQMADALHYCHQKGICHHDFKLENCVINRNLELRVIDFAYAMSVPPGQKMARFPGSPAYSAPEVLFRQAHDLTVDIFSLGTSLYYMLAGHFPFCDEEKTSFNELCLNVRDFRLDFPKHMSAEVCDLIRRMLAIDRIGWEDVFVHPWCTQEKLPLRPLAPSPPPSPPAESSPPTTRRPPFPTTSAVPTKRSRLHFSAGDTPRFALVNLA